MTNLFGDFYNAQFPHYLFALEQVNPVCVVISKTFPGNRQNEEVFQRVFWASLLSIEGFRYCRPILTINGTHLYRKCKGIIMIVMGCDENNQLSHLAFALCESENVDS